MSTDNQSRAFDLSIIIVNWNSRDFVRQCLRSIYTHAGAMQCEVIVVDNASNDGCEQMVESEFPQTVFIQTGKNIGFARANNVAFAQSRGRNVLFLNPDTEVKANALQNLVRALESIPTAGMVGARLLNSDLTLQTTCVTSVPSVLNQALNADYLRKTFPRWRAWGMRPLFDNNGVPVPVEAISGACMCARRDVIEAIGAFTTDYFMYSEDMDLCLKVAKSGWSIYYVPDAAIVHHAAGSSSSRKESNFSSIMLHESVLRFMELHRGSSYATLYRATTALKACCRILLLTLCLPIAVRKQSREFIRRAFSKWSAILVWSLGLNLWANAQVHAATRRSEGQA